MEKTQKYNGELVTEKFNHIIEKLNNIEEQTTKTNGRVTRLEQWKWYVLGFCGALGMLLIPVLLALFNNQL